LTLADASSETGAYPMLLPPYLVIPLQLLNRVLNRLKELE